MVGIDLEHIRHSYTAHPRQEEDFALKEVHLHWDDGGAYALLGPSGCGKTTLLNIISGLLKPSQGRILFEGRDVTGLSPEARNIAQVFQFPVVYDTMSVFDNLAFPLRNRGIGDGEVAVRVREILDMLDLGDVAQKKASGLAGDLKQKVSLGRGLVRKDVSAILFDEPLTVIDPHLKWQLRSQLKLLHKRFSHTMIYVTHDQTEALTFADKVVVMYEGEIVQIGTPEDLFERPMHTFVGYFIGSPGMNLLPASLEGGAVKVGGQLISLPLPVKSRPGARVQLGIRPEYIRFDKEGMPLRITKVEFIGRTKIVRALFEGMPISIVIGADETVPAEPQVSFDPKGINIYADNWRIDPQPSERVGAV